MGLKILIGHENTHRVGQVRAALANLGHEPVAREVGLADVEGATAEETPDLAIVIAEESSERILGLIAKLVRDAACPVIAILHTQDPARVKEAAKLGIFAFITDGQEPDELQGSIDIALRRFSEYRDLEGSLDRRAITERAKGVLMERHSIGEREALTLLRDHARRTNRKLVEVAEAVIGSHLLLPARKPAPRRRPVRDAEGRHDTNGPQDRGGGRGGS